MYFPILKAKSAEFNALAGLSDPVKSMIRPLFEFTPPDIDPDSKSWNRPLEAQLSAAVRNLSKSLSKATFIIDSPFLEDHMCGNEHHFKFLVNKLLEMDYRPMLAFGSARSDQFKKQVIELSGAHRLEICLRIEANLIDPAVDDPELLRRLISEFSDVVHKNKTEILILLDLATLPVPFLSSRRRDLHSLLSKLPELKEAVIIASGIPPETAPRSEQLIPYTRTCWSLWTELSKSFPNIQFGDYGTRSAGFTVFDPKKMSTSAKIWYTGAKDFLLAKGRGFKAGGRDDYQKLTKMIVNGGEFRGHDFSPGDEYLARCANGEIASKSPARWISISESQHFTYVVSKLSSYRET